MWDRKIVRSYDLDPDFNNHASKFPRSVGTCPTNVLEERSITPSREALDSEIGIEPKNLLVEMDKNLRLGRVRPMLSGRVPFS